MKTSKLLEIKRRCEEAQGSLEKEKEGGSDCNKCPLAKVVEIVVKMETGEGIDGVSLVVNPCLLLDTISGEVKGR